MSIIFVKPMGAPENQKQGFSPSGFSWGLQDISAEKSGRSDDTDMHKNRIGQARKIGLSWNGPDKDETSRILKAFNPEYVDMYYEDDMDNKWEWRTFYVGDRSAMRKCWWIGNKRHETVSFDIIEKHGRKGAF